MTRQPLFSVCIPTFDRSETIAWTIKSVLHQSLPDLELVVLDDSRDDLTRAVTELLIRQDSRVRYCQNSRRLGIVGNWNACIEQAKAQFIMILHHDDLLCPDALLRAKAFLDRHTDCGMVHADSLDIDLGTGRRFHRRTQQPVVLAAGDPAVQKVLFENNIACSTVVVRKECYSRCGVFLSELTSSPDWEMWARIGRSYAIGHIDEVGAVVVVDGRNTHMAGVDPLEFYQEQSAYVDRILGYLSSSEQNLPAMRVFAKKMLLNMMGRYCVLYLKAGRFKVAARYYEFLRDDVNVVTAVKLACKGILRYIQRILLKTTIDRGLMYAHLFHELCE